MVAVPVQAHSELNRAIVLSARALFLHFINRELLFLRKKLISEEEHIRVLKICGLLTSGQLLAPFAQVQEIYWRQKKINQLISMFCDNDKLHLCNGASDYYDFMEGRRTLYSPSRSKYTMYFNNTEQNKNLFRSSPKLDTTHFIKSELMRVITEPNKANIINSEDLTRLQGHKNYIRTELQDSTSAATFSIYEKSNINPKPDEVRFFGRISSQLFISHYIDMHDLITPTGVFNVEELESFDYFPIFDIELNAKILFKLGLGNIISDNIFHRPYFNIVSDPSFVRFSRLRVAFIIALVNTAGYTLGSVPHNLYNILSVLDSIDFRQSVDRTLITATTLAESLIRVMTKTATHYSSFGRALEEMNLGGKKLKPLMVFTATNVEDETFRAFCGMNSYCCIDVYTFKYFTSALYCNDKGVAIWHVRTSAGSGGGHGSARISEYAVRQIRPCFAISVGIAFGLLEDQQKISDVLVSEYIHGYEKAKISGSGIEPRGSRISCSPEILSFALQYPALDTSFKVHVGGILSGEKLVNDKDFRQKLRNLDPKAIGGEMETEGLAQSCHVSGIGFMMIKGIADFAVGKTDNFQQKAAENAFKFFFRMLDQFERDGILSEENPLSA